jgi:AcrR family transcriptional regulator
MLLYDFGSKEQLIDEVLAQVRRREETLLEADVRTLEDVWRWISAPQREPFLRLFFEVYVGALGRPEAEPFVRDGSTSFVPTGALRSTMRPRR